MVVELSRVILARVGRKAPLRWLYLLRSRWSVIGLFVQPARYRLQIILGAADAITIQIITNYWIGPHPYSCYRFSVPYKSPAP